jgi:RNAse (barnase) inhibitor barstar
MTSPLPLLKVADEPGLLILAGDPEAVSQAALDWADSGLVVRVVRGRKTRTLAGLFDEFAAALQFPWYFGENLDAFDECLTDLSWLPQQAGYVIVITDAGEVLADSGPRALGQFADLLTMVRERWASPVSDGQWWDRPAVPFHVVLPAPAGEVAALAERWTAAGAVVRPFPG